MQTKIIHLVLGLFILGSLHAQSVTGNGQVTKQNRTVEPFHAIATSHGWDLILTQGRENVMVVETDVNLHEHLITEVENGVLKIRMTKGLSIKKSKMKRIYLTFVEVDAISASGGSDIIAEQSITTDKFSLALSGGSDLKFAGLKVDKLSGAFSGGSDASIDFVNHSTNKMSIQASGGSDIRLEGVRVNSLSMATSGGSDVRIEGTAEEASIVASGGSDFDGADCIMEDCSLTMGGSSDAKIHVTGTLSAILGGGSDVSCTGNPRVVSKQVCKSCDLAL